MLGVAARAVTGGALGWRQRVTTLMGTVALAVSAG